MKKELRNFIETIEDYGEMYFTSGNLKKDYEQIKNTIKAQGFWSGCYYRFYFNDKLELDYLEEKKFGI